MLVVSEAVTVEVSVRAAANRMEVLSAPFTTLEEARLLPRGILVDNGAVRVEVDVRAALILMFVVKLPLTVDADERVEPKGMAVTIPGVKML